jgi:hypothetical protein
MAGHTQSVAARFGMAIRARMVTALPGSTGDKAMIPDQLKQEISAFDAMRDELFKHHAGKFVIVKDGQLQGAFDSFDAAGREAVRRFGQGPYLIRQVGAPTVIRIARKRLKEVKRG